MRNHFGEAFVAAKFFAAAFIDGDRRLTDIAACAIFSMHIGKSVANVTLIHVHGAGRGEGCMPRADRSITILTGMIIAALYVILLVGFTQESYMRRDFEMRRDAASRTNGSGTWPVIHDVSKRVCPIEPAGPLTLDGLRRAMAEEP